MTQMIRVFPQASIQFTSVDYLRHKLSDPIDKSNKLKKNISIFVCGGLSGMIAQFSTYPLEMVKTRLQMEKVRFSYKGMTNCFIKIYQDQGIAGFYKGSLIGMIGIVPYVGTSFFMYSILKQWLMDHYKQFYQFKLFDFIFGAIAGLTGQVISYPFDMVKKRLQAQRLLQIQGELQIQRSIIQTVVHIYQKEGIIRGFYKGMSLNFIKGPLSIGTVWSVKNTINRNLDQNYNF